MVKGWKTDPTWVKLKTDQKEARMKRHAAAVRMAFTGDGPVVTAYGLKDSHPEMGRVVR